MRTDDREQIRLTVGPGAVQQPAHLRRGHLVHQDLDAIARHGQQRVRALRRSDRVQHRDHMLCRHLPQHVTNPPWPVGCGQEHHCEVGQHKRPGEQQTGDTTRSGCFAPDGRKTQTIIPADREIF
jgi:hypothetical protein